MPLLVESSSNSSQAQLRFNSRMVATSECIKTKIITAKKVSKPLMEKKRRARINKCLDQLKYLLENYYTNNIRKRKLEKADILELTVRHLRNLQKIQNGPSTNSEISDYQAGFRNCLSGVKQYMLMADNSNGSNRLSVLAHLSSNLLGEHAPNSSTVDSDCSTRTAPEARQTAEANKTQSTVPLARCVRSLKPHILSRTSRVSHSQSNGLIGKLSSVANQVIGTAHIKTTQDHTKSSSCPINKDPPIVQCNEVVGTLLQNIWRPW